MGARHWGQYRGCEFVLCRAPVPSAVTAVLLAQESALGNRQKQGGRKGPRRMQAARASCPLKHPLLYTRYEYLNNYLPR